MDTTKIIKGVVNSGRYTVTAPIVKEDYGLYLQIEGVELPSTYEVDFSNSENSGTSVTMIGNSDGVLIPHQFIDTGKDIFAFLYHVGANYGRTIYKFRIPNKVRPDRTSEQPTPEEQSVIDQAISALNTAVAQTAQDVIDADVSAQNASADAERAEEARTDAQNYATQAQTSANNASASASQASASATASAQSASQSAQIKADVEDLADDAQGYAQASAQSASQASASEQGCARAVLDAASAAAIARARADEASGYAQTASTKAQDASTFAQTASTKASESAQSATNASQSAQTALQAKTDAQTAKTQAETARDNAVTAKIAAETAQGKAEDAQAAAESVAESIPSDYSQLSEDVSDLKEGLSAVEDRVKSLDDISEAYVNLSPPEESTEVGWRYGIVDTTGSIVFLNTKRLVTANTVDDAVVVLIEDGYEALIHAWDGSAYVGRYTTDDTFEKQAGTGKWFTSKIDLSKYIYKIFRLVIRKSDDTVFADPSEASTIIKFAQVKHIKDVVESCEQTSAEVAELVEEKDNATNSYVSSSVDPSELEWRYGNINTTGQHVSPTNTRRLTILDFIPTSTMAVGLSDGIISFLYAYDINTEAYLGRYTTDNEFSPSEGTAQQFTGQIDLSVFSGKIFRIVLKKSDNSAFASQDGSNLITLENKIYIKDLAEKVEAIEKSRGINQYSYVGSPEIYIPTDTTDSVIDSMQASEIYTMYDNLVTNYPKWISRASDIGVDSDNNPIRHYIIRMGNACYNNASYPNVSTNNWISNFDNKHILINAGTHGDEKTSVLGVARFAELLLASTDKWAMFIKSNFVLHIIPILNVWGFNNMSRENKDGININRDYADFATTEAQSVRDLCEQLGDNLKAIIDSHNTQSDIGMMGTKPAYTDYLYNIRTATCLASVLTPYLSNHYNADKFPYFYAWESTSSNTLMDFTNINGYIGGTIETPRNYNSGAVNHAETSTMVVGLLANLIPTYGTKDM